LEFNRISRKDPGHYRMLFRNISKAATDCEVRQHSNDQKSNIKQEYNVHITSVAITTTGRSFLTFQRPQPTLKLGNTQTIIITTQNYR